MKRIILSVVLAAASMSVMADQNVKGYTRSDGTYVQPHVRTTPNNNTYDNYSTKGNTNPYTGKEGTVAPDNNPYSTNNPYESKKSRY